MKFKKILLISMTMSVSMACAMSEDMLAGDKSLIALIVDAQTNRKRAIEKVVQAIKNKDLAGVKKYIDDGGDVNVTASSDEMILPGSLLEHSVYYNNIQAAQWLLAKGAHVNGQTGRPLHAAIYKCNAAFVDLFLDHGANIEKGLFKETPLMKAAGGACCARGRKRRNEYLPIIDLLMRRGADINAKQFGDGQSEEGTVLERVVGIFPSCFPVDWKYGIYNRLPLIKKLMRWGARGNIDRALLKRADNAEDYAHETRKTGDFEYKYEREKKAIEDLQKYVRTCIHDFI